ncbi:MAG TPA: ABC transporter permease [Solirubrobacteraceae bacterium]
MTTAQLELRQIKGPSALGGGWRRFINLTWLVASSDFKLTYFGSVLGYLWSFVQPLLFFGVLYLVFGVVLAKAFVKVSDFPVLLLMNIVLFNFFQGATGTAVASVLVRENLVRKMHFPRLVIPLAVVTTAAMQLMLNLVVVLLFMLIYGIQPRVTWLLLPVIALAFFVFSCGVAMLLSSLYVRYRDVAPIWGVISQALFYASPVFITIESIQVHGQTVTRAYMCNPLAAMLQQARHWMIGNSPGTPAIMGGYAWALIPAVIGIGICVLGFYVFNREAPRIAEEL